MNFQRILIIFCAVALLPAIAFVKIKEKVVYDPNSPTSVVKAANKMLALCDFEQLLEITELSEKKRTQMTIDTIKTNAGAFKIIVQESQKIEFFEILKEEIYTNNTDILAIVYTKWRMKIDLAKKPGTPVVDPANPSKPYSEVYVDYLLRKFDGKWKIISKKSK